MRQEAYCLYCERLLCAMRCSGVPVIVALAYAMLYCVCCAGCAVLCCAVLCCAALRFAVVRYTMLCCTLIFLGSKGCAVTLSMMAMVAHAFSSSRTAHQSCLPHYNRQGSTQITVCSLETGHCRCMLLLLAPIKQQTRVTNVCKWRDD